MKRVIPCSCCTETNGNNVGVCFDVIIGKIMKKKLAKQPPLIDVTLHTYLFSPQKGF